LREREKEKGNEKNMFGSDKKKESGF